MGKEAKLGVAVIGLLSITFCAVLAWRLWGPSGDDTQSVAENEASAAAEGEDSGQSVAHAAAKPSSATVVAASPSSTEAPSDPPDPVGQWNVATDEGPVRVYVRHDFVLRGQSHDTDDHEVGDILGIRSRGVPGDRVAPRI